VASGFYATLLESRRWWADELAGEGMMSLTSLPSPATTNGTWLNMQARHNIILGMITWNDKWGPRYGVNPGYGITLQNGFEARTCSRRRAVIFFGWVFFLISSGSPHVRCTPMWALSTRGEPDEIELTPMGVTLNGSLGMQDVFTSIAMAALEWGAMP